MTCNFRHPMGLRHTVLLISNMIQLHDCSMRLIMRDMCNWNPHTYTDTQFCNCILSLIMSVISLMRLHRATNVVPHDDCMMLLLAMSNIIQLQNCDQIETYYSSWLSCHWCTRSILLVLLRMMIVLYYYSRWVTLYNCRIVIKLKHTTHLDYYVPDALASCYSSRGGGLGSRPIFKKFNEPYAPS